MAHRSRPGIVGGLVGLLSLILAACGGGSSSTTTSPPKIGVVLTYNLPGFWSNYLSYEQKAESDQRVKLMGPYIANVEAKGNEVQQQISDVKTLISQGAQALIINPADSSAIAPALDYAKSKNIPVVTVDVAPDQGSVYMIVRADNVAYGTKSCDYIASHASSPGTIAMIEGDLTSLNARDRAQGCNQIIQQKYPNFTVKAYMTKDWDTKGAVDNATTALTAISNLRGIYVHWSVPEQGIIAAEQSKNLFAPVGSPNHIPLVGNDGSPDECNLIRGKQLDATIDQPADQYARYAVFYAKQAIQGAKYSIGQKTDHDSTIVNVVNNPEDALAAPLIDQSNVSDPSMWCNNR